MSNQIAGDLSESAITAKRYVWKMPEFSSLRQTIFIPSPSFTFMNTPFHCRVFPPDNYFGELHVILMYESGSIPDLNYSISLRRSDGTLFRAISGTIYKKMFYYPAVTLKASDFRSQSLAFYTSDTLTLIFDLCEHTLPLAEVANNVKEKIALEPREHTSLAGNFFKNYYSIKIIYREE